jgi:hypothetical protein
MPSLGRQKNNASELMDSEKRYKRKDAQVLFLRYNETRTKTADHTNTNVPNNPIATYLPFAQTAHVRTVNITEGQWEANLARSLVGFTHVLKI